LPAQEEAHNGQSLAPLTTALVQPLVGKFLLLFPNYQTTLVFTPAVGDAYSSVLNLLYTNESKLYEPHDVRCDSARYDFAVIME
jgi:hypothetical protein